MQEEVANCDRFYSQNMISARCFSFKSKKKTLATQGFLDMEHSGIEPLTSTLPEGTGYFRLDKRNKIRKNSAGLLVDITDF
ncbi:hypothetical protein QUF86_08575 [Peribacillus sp. NJ11]|uniref:hypothetical protein n=1 Tax=Peribacillus sp. NJ11 TaxID=3055861 RepID=UPI0025A1E423|nr:hypothetical protein [Peribacillus sp. NJ11]MDM5220803.1 hypothetical protein [Peribacillus sp. NJ11]